MTDTISSYEEWIASLTNEEAIKALWERLELVQKDNATLNERVEHLESRLQQLINIFNAHKHAETTGEPTMPTGGMKF